MDSQFCDSCSYKPLFFFEQHNYSCKEYTSNFKICIDVWKTQIIWPGLLISMTIDVSYSVTQKNDQTREDSIFYQIVTPQDDSTSYCRFSSYFGEASGLLYLIISSKLTVTQGKNESDTWIKSISFSCAILPKRLLNLLYLFFPRTGSYGNVNGNFQKLALDFEQHSYRSKDTFSRYDIAWLACQLPYRRECTVVLSTKTSRLVAS